MAKERTKARKKVMTTEEVEQMLKELHQQIKKISMTLTFSGTRKEQVRTVRLMNSLSEEAQIFVLASAIANSDYFGGFGGVFLEREHRLRNAKAGHHDLSRRKIRFAPLDLPTF